MSYFGAAFRYSRGTQAAYTAEHGSGKPARVTGKIRRGYGCGSRKSDPPTRRTRPLFYRYHLRVATTCQPLGQTARYVHQSIRMSMGQICTIRQRNHKGLAVTLSILFGCQVSTGFYWPESLSLRRQVSESSFFIVTAKSIGSPSRAARNIRTFLDQSTFVWLETRQPWVE